MCVFWVSQMVENMYSTYKFVESWIGVGLGVHWVVCAARMIEHLMLQSKTF